MTMTSRMFHGIPREKILWNPSIDAELCIGCGECLDVCANGVFKRSEESGKVMIVDPMNCVVLCDKCKTLCPVAAISFPDKSETQKSLVELFRGRKEDSAENEKGNRRTLEL